MINNILPEENKWLKNGCSRDILPLCVVHEIWVPTNYPLNNLPHGSEGKGEVNQKGFLNFMLHV